MASQLGFAACLCLGLVAIGLSLDIENFALSQQSASFTWLSAHWVHLNSEHALVNAAGWIITTLFAYRRITVRGYLILTTGFSLSIAAAWLAIGSTTAYAGLSGVLFAWWTCLAVCWMAQGNGLYGCLLLAMLLICASGGVSQQSFVVAASAHWSGMAIGGAAGLLLANWGHFELRTASDQASIEPDTQPGNERWSV